MWNLWMKVYYAYMYFQIQSTNVNVNLNASVTKIVLNFVAKNPFTCVVSGNGGLNTISAKRRRRLCRTLSAHTYAQRHLKHHESHISQRFVVLTITFLEENTFSHWRYQLAISRKWYNRATTRTMCKLFIQLFIHIWWKWRNLLSSFENYQLYVKLYVYCTYSC